MRHIFAIGGGELHQHGTLALDRAIVAATGKGRPNALFLPTASGDACGYVHAFERVYGQELGCETEVLRLVERQPVPTTIRALIDWADLIYVGGGDTQRMMAIWRETGVDALLRQKADTGAVLAGLSAGAECWFRHFGSEEERPEDTRPLVGLGLVDLAVWPHLPADPTRWQGMTLLMQAVGGAGIGLPDGVAAEFLGQRYRILSCSTDAAAVLFLLQGGRIVTQPLPPHPDFRPTPVAR